MQKTILWSLSLAGMALPAAAQTSGGTGLVGGLLTGLGGLLGGGARPVHDVPEIDAGTGVLAVAAVLALLAFVRDRRRRQA